LSALKPKKQIAKLQTILKQSEVWIEMTDLQPGLFAGYKLDDIQDIDLTTTKSTAIWIQPTGKNKRVLAFYRLEDRPDKPIVTAEEIRETYKKERNSRGIMRMLKGAACALTLIGL
jgi:hypothetical protein